MSKNAFATIHFGSNPVYLELELYFFLMLRKYTKNDILYLYSVNDTPQSFVDAVRPLVDSVIPYDDKGITYDVQFESGYSNFNTLRTCNFIFAYTLEKYDKVCIIESDMVVMGNLDSVFKLNCPAVLTYYIGEKRLKENAKVSNTPEDAI
jgi:lipopolysaccharide biosynthesis glycosyltransferase